MDDDRKPNVTGGKTLRVGSEVWPLADPGVAIHHVDFITEARQHNGTVFLSFANTVIDGSNAGEAIICARLRMNLSVAQAIHHILGEMISDAHKPIDQSKAN